MSRWAASSVWLTLACSIQPRVVEERGTGDNPSLLGGSSGSGGGASAGSPGRAGAPSKLPEVPEPLSPKFKNGDPCESLGVYDDTGSGGDGGETGCGGGCPTPVIAKGISPGSPVVSRDEVFWSDRGNLLLRTGVDGQMTEMVATLSSPVTGLAVDASRVYIQTETTISRVARGGGEVQVLASDQVARGLALDRAHVYWLSVKQGRNSLRRYSLVRGTSEVRAELPSFPLAITLDDQNVYVLGKHEVLKLPKCEEGEVVLASSEGLGGGIAADAGYVYWSDGEAVQRVPRAGGAPEFVATVRDGHFVVSDSFLYGAGEVGQGELLRWPVTGGAAQVHADDLANPIAFDSDETSVYFMNGQQIRKVEKK